MAFGVGVAVAGTELSFSSLLAISSGVDVIPFRASAVFAISGVADFSVSSVELSGAEPVKGSFIFCSRNVSMFVGNLIFFCFSKKLRGFLFLFTLFSSSVKFWHFNRSCHSSFVVIGNARTCEHMRRRKRRSFN